MKLILVLATSVFLAACQGTVAYKPIEGSEYVQVQNTPFDRFILKDPSALANYDKIIFSALKFDKWEIEPSRDNTIDKSWQLTVDDKVAYAGYFKDELMKIYGGDNAQTAFGLGTGRNPQTLYAEVRLLKLRPMVAKHGQSTSGTISQKSVESFGSLTAQIMLVDSVTNEFVAVIEDGRDLSTGRQAKAIINSTTDAYIWKRTFNSWLRDLKDTATELKSGV